MASKLVGALTNARQTTVQLPPALSATKEGHTRMIIRAKPGAKRNGVLDIGETVVVQIAEPPRDGKANAQLCEFFSSLLSVKKSQVSLTSGMKSKDKVVVVQLPPEETLERLRESLDID